MINKKVETVQEALQIRRRHDNYVRRFWFMWNPENAIAELVTKGTTDLTCISNNAGR
jgi:3-oxoacid CoA-transferase subunit A